MKNLFILLVVGATASCQLKTNPGQLNDLLSAGGIGSLSGGDGNAAAPGDTTTGELRLDETPVTFQHLQLYAVRRNLTTTIAHDANYKTLKEALDSKVVVVSESGATNQNSSRNGLNTTPTTDNVVMEENQIGGGERVNTLQVENLSNDTIFLMAGELVKGGKQDRVIAKDMLLPPKSGKRDLPVFCVEHGRWTYHADGVNNSFDGYSNVVSNTVRDAVVNGQDQGKVWSEVDNVTKANGAVTETSTYNGLEASGDFQKKSQPYLDFYKDKFKNNTDIVGIIAMSGDTLIGADVFYNPFMFDKQINGLLHSYVTDVVTKPVSTVASLQGAKKCFEGIKAEYTNAAKPTEGKMADKNRVLHYSKF